MTGFTLLELVLAVAIFSIISIAGVYVLRQTVAGAEQQVRIINSTTQLQQALWLLSQDLYNLIDRPITVDKKIQEPLYRSEQGIDGQLGDGYRVLMHLTRASWIDSTFKHTSKLLRVCYALKYDDETGYRQLVRLHWPYPDRFATQKPIEAVLIKNILKGSVVFYSEGKKDLKKWPLKSLREIEADTETEDLPPIFPDGIKLSLELEDYGEFEKIISINVNTRAAEPKEQDEDEDDDEDEQ